MVFRQCAFFSRLARLSSDGVHLNLPDMAGEVLAPGECELARGELGALELLRLLLGPLCATLTGCAGRAGSTSAAPGAVVHGQVAGGIRVPAPRRRRGESGGIAPTSRRGRQSSLSGDIEVVVWR